MNSKILLIPSINVVGNAVRRYIPYGLLLLMASAGSYRKYIDIYMFGDQTLGRTFRDADELTDAILADIDLSAYRSFGFSTVCNSFHHSLLLAEKISQKKPEAEIWMGGPHASLLADKIISTFNFIDAVFVGESEPSFSNVLRRRYENASTSLEGIPGICTRQWGLIGRSPVVILDELPYFEIPEAYIKQNYFPQESVFKAKRTVPLEVTRGCPGACTFCSAKVFWGNRVRRKSPQRILAEMQHLKSNTGYADFMFIGDNFEASYDHLMTFCDHMNNHHNTFAWACSLKLDRLRITDLQALWDAGCRGFFVGLESASQCTLNRISKGVDLQHRLNIIKNAIDMGFTIEVSFIIGFPWENDDDLNATLALHHELLKAGVFRSIVFTLCPLPGTKLANEYLINFDFRKSDIAYDDIPLGNRAMQIVKNNPPLFPQFGFFQTPNIERARLLSVRHTANQLSYFYSSAYSQA